MKTDRRLGKIIISTNLIQDMDINEFLKVTSKFVVVRCEHLYMQDVVEYIVICPEFDEVERGEIIPTYTVEIRKDVEVDGTATIDVKFIRQK